MKPNQSINYNLVSASLYNFLPNIEVKKHENIFNKIIETRKQSIIDLEVENNLKVNNYSLINLEELKNNSFIICTFHIGSYRIINQYLAKHKIPFSLVISKNVIDTQGIQIKDSFSQYTQKENNDLELIDAELPNSLFKMTKAIKNGKSLVIYIDGNLGSGNDTLNNENHFEINFLNKSIFVRRGIGLLATITKKPVLPVISYRDHNNFNILNFYKPVISNENLDRNSNAKYIIKELYKKAEIIIREYPEQWEGWLYLYKISKINNKEIINVPESDNISDIYKKKFKFNIIEFGLFTIENDFYIFQKFNYCSFKIDNQLYNALLNSNFKRINLNDLTSINLINLINKRVLISHGN
jgi:lauroyl/myristoyl acyltransferase